MLTTDATEGVRAEETTDKDMGKTKTEKQRKDWLPITSQKMAHQFFSNAHRHKKKQDPTLESCL
jgi:hypothetical protein